jgi:hypothetical protein
MESCRQRLVAGGSWLTVKHIYRKSNRQGRARQGMVIVLSDRKGWQAEQA